MKKIMSHIEFFKSQLKELEVLHILREGNNMADALAKSGVFRKNDLLVFYR